MALEHLCVAFQNMNDHLEQAHRQNSEDWSQLWKTLLKRKDWTNWAYCLEKPDKNLQAEATSKEEETVCSSCSEDLNAETAQKNPKVRCNEK